MFLMAFAVVLALVLAMVGSFAIASKKLSKFADDLIQSFRESVETFQEKIESLQDL